MFLYYELWRTRVYVSCNIYETICYFLAKDMQPMDTINDEFEPRYTRPDRKTISTGSTCYLSDLHEREKQCLQKLLKEIYNYSITTDLWTSRAKHASLQEYEMMSCHKNKRSPMKISPGGSPPTKTDPHQIDASTTYIYIYIIYI